MKEYYKPPLHRAKKQEIYKGSIITSESKPPNIFIKREAETQATHEGKGKEIIYQH